MPRLPSVNYFNMGESGFVKVFPVKRGEFPYLFVRESKVADPP